MAPTVETTSGTVRGSQGPGYQSFLGIPFAAPPVGERRFRPPTPPSPWPGERDATVTGPWAPQNATRQAARIGGEDDGQDEDCLNLNVWTPAAGDGRRPVMVWIHGGGFETGSGAGLLYRGDRLALHSDVVVVTVNYRLGLLGFAAAEALRDPDTGIAGNWGLLDQIAALEWVRDNIAAFGGDPGNVTIFGESAGSMSVTTLVGTPAAAGLFRRAIGESGPPAVASLDHGERALDAVLTELGVSGGGAAVSDALRSLPVEQLLAAQAAVSARRRLGEGSLPFSPVIEGASLPEAPLAVAARGATSAVELLIGTNREETTLFAVGDRAAFTLDEAALRRRLARVLPGAAARPSIVDDAIDVYGKARSDRGDPTTPSALWTAILTDLVFRVPSMRFAAAHAAHQANTFTYLFTWPTPVLGGILGSPHALEIPFVFGTLDQTPFDTFTGADREPAVTGELSRRMMDAWTTFARTGSPSPDWPAYSAGSGRQTMILDRSCEVASAPLESERGFVEELLAAR